MHLHVELPAQLNPGAELKSLMPFASWMNGSNCGSSFRVDPIGP
jgi:ribonuclease T2